MPVFIRPLHPLENILEGGFAHFEAQITPVSDPSMKVEWLFNGKPLTAGKIELAKILDFCLINCSVFNNFYKKLFFHFSFNILEI